MSDLTLFILLTLSTYYLFYLISLSTLLIRPRESFYDHCPPSHHRAGYRSRWNEQTRTMHLVARAVSTSTPIHVSRWGQLVACPWCLGFWLSVLVVGVADMYYLDLPLPLLWLSGVACGVGLVGTWKGEKNGK